MKPNRSGNYSASLGVYKFMVRGAGCLLLGGVLCSGAFGQFRQDDPLSPALTAYNKAREQGRSADAAALREDARRVLDRLPVEAPQFGAWVQSVAQLYASAGRTAQQRAVLETALDRAGSLGATSPARIQFLTSLADFWRQDRNLPKAAEYFAKAIAAQEIAPNEQAAPVGRQWFTSHGIQARNGNFYSRGFQPGDNLSNLYQRLADVQQQLGHPDAVAALNDKIRALAVKSGDQALASYLEQHGDLAAAAAIYRNFAERAATAQESVSALQSLANVYQRQERFADAASAQQQVVARLEAGGTPDLRSQATGARQTLAGLLQQAGRVEQADAVYRDLLAAGGSEQQAQLLFNYAGYLSSTQRGAQAMALLKEFQASHPTLRQPWEESGLYYALENAARAAGDSKQAGEYRALAIAKQPQSPPDTTGQPSIDALFQKALSAVGAGKTGEAFDLAMRAMDTAPRLQNREQAGWQVSSMASTLAAKNSAASAELLYQRALSLAQGWSVDNLQPLLGLASNYARFLIAQSERRADVPAAIERYRRLIVMAAGADSGAQEEALRLTIEFERTRAHPPVSLLAPQDLVAYEEAVNGNTSEPYLRALRTLAEAYDFNGDREHAIPVRKQIVRIADLVYPANDSQRGQTRVDAAMALAYQGEFDEAERLASEAAAIGKDVKPVGSMSFEYALHQVGQMRAAATQANRNR